MNEQQQFESKLKRRRAWDRTLAYDPQLPADLVQALWEGPVERLICQGEPLQVKDRGVVVRYRHATGEFLLKRNIWGGVGRTVRKLHRASTARRCADVGCYLAEQGIPTPQPRAFLEHRVGPFSYRSYLVTDFVPGTSLFHFLRYNTFSTEQVRRLARQVAQIWERLIELKISHNDLKPENFLVDEHQRVWLIDMEKVRIHRDEPKLRRRHLEDARIFLHVRSWREHPEAAEIFRQELLKTALGAWCADAGPQHPLNLKFARSESSTGISVAIITDEKEVDPQLIARSVESVRNLADEIVLVGPDAEEGEFEVRSTLPLAGHASANAPFTLVGNRRRLAHPWVLLLTAGECATPDLVRELPEQIADNPQCAAVRVPVQPVMFGRPLAANGRAAAAPIRAIHQDRVAFSLRNGIIESANDPADVHESPQAIQHDLCSRMHDFLDDLNRQTTRGARTRLQQGCAPHLFRVLFRSAASFASEYVLERGFRNGWVGLQAAAMRATYTWVEEVKLWQMLFGFQSLPHASRFSEPDLSEASPLAANSRRIKDDHQVAKAA